MIMKLLMMIMKIFIIKIYADYAKNNNNDRLISNDGKNDSFHDDDDDEKSTHALKIILVS